MSRQLKDHEIAELVNELTEVAVKYKDCQSLGGVLSNIVLKKLKSDADKIKHDSCYKMWDKKEKRFYLYGKTLFSRAGFGWSSIAYHHKHSYYDMLTKEEQRERYEAIEFELITADPDRFKELQEQ